MTVQIRQIRPSDYRPVIAVIDGWWDGRQMADMLPRLFFEHFTETSFAAERDGEVVGFLVGFLSQSRLGQGVYPFRRRPPGGARPRPGSAALPALLRCRPGLADCRAASWSAPHTAPSSTPWPWACASPLPSP